MSTSKSNPPNQPGQAPNPYARFIPREELGNFAAWSPETFEKPAVTPGAEQSGVRKPTLAERAAAEVRQSKPSTAHHAPQARGEVPAAATAPKPAVRRPVVGGMPGQAEAQEKAQAQADAGQAMAASVDEQLHAARQSAYQDGYRNGLAALESYKQTQAAQLAAQLSDQVGALASDFHQRLEALEQQLAGRIAGVALELGRQVVRSELRQRPEVVVETAEEALGVLLAAARQIVLRLHPEDHALAQGQLGELLGSRGARLLADPNITRGGCVVESDIAVVDASVEARWSRAAAGLGHQTAWSGGREALGDTENHVPEALLESDADEPFSDPVERDA